MINYSIKVKKAYCVQGDGNRSIDDLRKLCNRNSTKVRLASPLTFRTSKDVLLRDKDSITKCINGFVLDVYFNLPSVCI